MCAQMWSDVLGERKRSFPGKRQPAAERRAHGRERGCSPAALREGTEVLKKVVFSDFLWKVAGNLLDKIFCEK